MDKYISAEIGIRRLHALCADAVWRKDLDAFAQCFTVDGEWKIAGLHCRGRTAIGETLGQLLTQNERVLMNFGEPILDFGSSEISGRTYAVEQVKPWTGEAQSTIGLYFEKFAEIDGQWLFTWRHFDMYYFGPANLSNPLFEFRDYGPSPATPLPDAPTDGLRVSD